MLFASHTTQPGAERIEAVSTKGGSRSVIVERAVTPIWSVTGHLLFARDGAVLAAPFDSASATLRGAAMPVIREGVVGTQRSGTLGLRLSPAGTLAFIPPDTGISRVVSVGRDGAALPLNLPLARHTNPRLSPDGRRLLVTTSDAFLEALDLTRGTRVRLTAAAPGTYFPSWTADGQRVVFRRYNSPFWVAADGSGKEAAGSADAHQRLPLGAWPRSRLHDCPSGCRQRPRAMSFLISISGAVRAAAARGHQRLRGRGRNCRRTAGFLLYQSNESGQFEVYVRRYPSARPELAGIGRRRRPTSLGARWPRDRLPHRAKRHGGRIRDVRSRTGIPQARGALCRRLRLRPRHVDRELRCHSSTAVSSCFGASPTRVECAQSSAGPRS